ncbi:AraC family transcriptional regulator [Burkholderia multivorans]|uniref:AraC family transcriptional regulator n=1 Tax=Burkholderia multivorans TaxID=87883 RepID=UPI002158FB0D|nr:AraC family transcriptional regulator [Burkholderia multivorans]
MPLPTVYRPQLCLVAQGQKEAMLGDLVFRYAPGRYGIVTCDLPVTGQIVEARPDAPYLCMFLEFDPAMLGQLALRVPPPPDAPRQPIGKTVSQASACLLDAALRLLRLFDDPAALPVLGPLAEQEILYRLLAGARQFQDASHRFRRGSDGSSRPRDRLDCTALPGTTQHRAACHGSGYESV